MRARVQSACVVPEASTWRRVRTPPPPVRTHLTRIDQSDVLHKVDPLPHTHQVVVSHAVAQIVARICISSVQSAQRGEVGLEHPTGALDVTESLSEGIRVLKSVCGQVGKELSGQESADDVGDITRGPAVNIVSDGHAHETLQEFCGEGDEGAREGVWGER